MFHFPECIPKVEDKKKLVKLEPLGFKIKKFYAECAIHYAENLRFFQFCRFYWYEKDIKPLLKVINTIYSVGCRAKKA